jgi:hypothetical protein
MQSVYGEPGLGMSARIGCDEFIRALSLLRVGLREVALATSKPRLARDYAAIKRLPRSENEHAPGCCRVRGPGVAHAGWTHRLDCIEPLKCWSWTTQCLGSR